MDIESDLPPDELLRRSELALGFAGMAGEDTPLGEELARRGRAMQAAAFNAKFGPVPEFDGTDDDLLRELQS